MREIKFRAKIRYSLNGVWIYGDLTQQNGCVGIDTHKRIYEVNPETVGQFTGLYDKNGKEIYEGDIVRATIFDVFGCKEYKLRIIFDKYEAAFMAETFDLKNAWRASWVIKLDNDSEVIGNIHDTPELIKKEE